MPLYFSDVAPTCPVSHDGLVGPTRDYVLGRAQIIRPTIPAATDLQSAIVAANLTRTILQSLVYSKTINNTGGGSNTQSPAPKITRGKDKFKNKTARWVEQKDKRVKHKYKYYGEGNDRSIYATMERIERMVWYDRGWKVYMFWEYGPKGEGEPV